MWKLLKDEFLMSRKGFSILALDILDKIVLCFVCVCVGGVLSCALWDV